MSNYTFISFRCRRSKMIRILSKISCALDFVPILSKRKKLLCFVFISMRTNHPSIILPETICLCSCKWPVLSLSFTLLLIKSHNLKHIQYISFACSFKWHSETSLLLDSWFFFLVFDIFQASSKSKMLRQKKNCISISTSKHNAH